MSVFGDVIDFFTGIGETAVDVVGTGFKTLSGFFDLFDDGGFKSLTNLAGSFLFEGAQLLASREAAEAALKVGESEGNVLFANAQLLADEAAKVRGRTDIEVAKSQLQGARFMSNQISGFLNSGVTLQGSPLLVLDETADLIALEIEEIRTDGEDKQFVLEERAKIEELKAEAKFDEASFKAEAIIVGQIADSTRNILGL